MKNIEDNETLFELTVHYIIEAMNELDDYWRQELVRVMKCFADGEKGEIPDELRKYYNLRILALSEDWSVEELRFLEKFIIKMSVAWAKDDHKTDTSKTDEPEEPDA